MQKIAIFDIDNTILSVDSFFKFILYIFKKYPFKLIYLPYFTILLLLRGLNFISIEKLKEKFLNKLIGNFPDENINKLSNDFINDEILKKIKPNIKEYITKLKNEGYKIIFATASFEFYIKNLAFFLDVDTLVATQISREKNKFYIKGKNCKDIEKISRITKILDRKDIDRENSMGFSDSSTDIFFLELCKKFYIVHKKKWEILKEYIY